MINYLKQVAVSESVRETIKRALNRSDEMEVRMKASRIPTTDSILRAVSLAPHIDGEESLREFIADHILDSLRLTPSQKEHIKLNS